MPSPFPGMDPYLEDPHYWQDVHQRLITYLCDDVQTKLPPRYVARIGERVYVQEPEKVMYPDMLIREQRTPRRRVPRSEGGVATTVMKRDEPEVLTVNAQEMREPFIEIRTVDGRLVTVIEVLSHTNKMKGSDGRKLYLEKQAQILRSNVHLLEIDLLRAGEHTVAIPLALMVELPYHHYRVVLSRANERQKLEVWVVPITKRLPRISVPLLSPDPDVVVDLQALFDRCYNNGGYARFLRYDHDPPPPLHPDDLAWVRKLLKRRKK